MKLSQAILLVSFSILIIYPTTLVAKESGTSISSTKKTIKPITSKSGVSQSVTSKKTKDMDTIKKEHMIKVEMRLLNIEALLKELIRIQNNK